MAGKSPASHHSISSGKTAPTLIPTGKFEGKPEVPLSRTVTLVGSGAGARLQLISSSVSKSHALIVNCDRGLYVRDLASRTKVIVNGSEVREAVLKQGDRIQFGKFAFTVTEPPGRDDEARERPEPPPAAQVEVTGVDSPIPLHEKCLLIGRRDTCDIVIADESVSTAHAVIFEMDGRRFVRDLSSRTGTFVNGTQVHQAELELGDTIRIGTVDLKYAQGEEPLGEELFESQDMSDLVATHEEGELDEAAAAAIAAGEAPAAQPAIPEHELDVEEVPLEVEDESPAEATELAPRNEPLPLQSAHETGREEAEISAPVDVDDLVMDHLESTEPPPADQIAPSEELPAEQEQPAGVSAETPLELAEPEPLAIDEVPDEVQREEVSAEMPAEEIQAPPPQRPASKPFLGMAGGLEFAAPIDLRNVRTPDESPAPPPAAEEPVAETQEPEAPSAPELEEIPIEDELSIEPPVPLEVETDEPAIEQRAPEEIAVDSSKLMQPAQEIDEIANASQPAEDQREAPNEEPLEELMAEAPEEEVTPPVFEAPEEPAEEAPVVDINALEEEATEQAAALTFDAPAVQPAESEQAAEAVEPELDELAIPKEPSEPLTFTGPTSEVAPLDFGDVAGEGDLGIGPGAEGADDLKLDLTLDETLPAIGADALDESALKLDLGPDLIPPPPPPPPAVAAPVELASPDIPLRPIGKRPSPRKRKPTAEKKQPPPAPPPAPVELSPRAVDKLPVAEAPVEPAVDQSALSRHQEAPPEPPAGSVEVMEEAQPSPDAALEVGQELEKIDVVPQSTSEIEQPADLTDTGFGRDVEHFTEEATTGELVEDSQTSHKPRTEEPPAATETDESFLPNLQRDLGLAEEPSLEAEEQVEAPASPEDSMADLLAQDEPTEEDLASDPLAGFASFNTLARSLDLPEPVESLPGLEPGAEEKFSTLSEPEASPLDEALSNERARLDAHTPGLADEAPPTHVSEPAESILVDEPAPSAEGVNVEPTPLDIDLDDLTVESAPEAHQEAPSEDTSAQSQQAPEVPPQPVAPQPQPAPARPASPDPSTWGANLEHFLGGMPLSLGDISAPQVTPPPMVARPAPQGPRPKPASQPGAPTQPAIEGAPGIVPPARPAPIAAAPPLIPPPQRARPTPKPRNANTGGMGLVSSPTDQPRPRQVKTGFDGLAMGAPRHVDVFSQMPMAPAGDPFAGGGGGASADVFGRNNNAGAPQPQRPARKSLSTPRRSEQAAESASETWAAEAPPPEIPTDAQAPAEDVPPPSPARKKRRWFGLKSLLFLMILCTAGTGAGVWFLMPNHATARGRLRFANFAKLTQLERIKLDRAQQELLASEQVRREAEALLSASGKGVGPGFLDKPSEFGQAVAGAKLDLESGVLNVSYISSDAQYDKPRMKALMQALYNGNLDLKTQAASLRDEISNLTNQQKQKQKEVENLKSQLDQLSQAAESRPDPGEMTRLESEATRLEGEYRDSVVAVAKLSADIDKLKQQSAVATTLPAGSIPVSAQTVDTQLAQYQADFQKLTERVATVKDMRTKKAAAARAALDAAMASFQKQIQQARDAVKGNQELSEYFANAEALQTQTKELTESFLRRQEGQYARLNELKARMDEKMAARRDDAMKNDPKMKEYLQQKEIKTRQYNAAVGAGYTKEADEYKADLSLLEQMIKARQTQIGDDQFYADAIDQLQKIIDTTQKGIQDDRKETEKVLEQMRVAFAKSQPKKDKLPEDQKALAADLEKRLGAVEEARKQYTDAAELANAQADEEIRQMEANASSLSDKISARKRQLEVERDKNFQLLTAREREATLVQKQQELARAQSVKASAEAAYTAAKTKFVEAQNRLNAARDAGDKRDGLTRVYDQTNRELNQVSDQLDMKRKLADARAEPIPPDDGDVQVITQEDPKQRLMYTLAGMGGVAAFFTGLLVVSAASTPLAYPPAPAFGEPAPLEQEPEYQDQYDEIAYEQVDENAFTDQSSAGYLPEDPPSEENGAAVA